MNAIKAAELIREYAECRKCGSKVVNNGEGSLLITDEVIKRECKCGWSIEIKENGQHVN